MHNKKEFLHFIYTWLPVFLWSAAIFYVSSYPTAQVTDSPQKEFVVKKFAHVVEYAILATLFYRALLIDGATRREAGICAILFVFLYGSSDEIHERFVVGRQSHARDVIIDTLGASLAIAFIWKLLPIAPPKLTNLAKKLGIR